MINQHQPDLTQHPPRSVRVRLGGYAHLPRLLDKARAVVGGQIGAYHYNCPLDQLFFAFTGIAPEALLAAAREDRSDVELLAWVNEHAPRSPAEIAAWSSWLEQHGPGGAEGHAWVVSVLQDHHSTRNDIRSFADILDLDDYLTFGGRA